MTTDSTTPETPAAAPAPTETPATPEASADTVAGGEVELSTEEKLYGTDTPAGGDDTTEGGDDTVEGGDDTLKGGDEDTTEGGDKDEKEGEEGDAEKIEMIEYGEFKLPEDLPADENDVTWLKAFGSKHKMPKEAVQELIDKHADAVGRGMDSWEQIKEVRKAELQNHPTLGGENLESTKNIGNLVMSKFANGNLAQKIIDGGLGFDPDLADFLMNVHKATGEDSVGDDVPGSEGEGKTHADILYKDMPG